LEEAQEVIGQWIEEDYNQFYPHSKLGYKSPREFEKQYYELQGGRALNLYTFGG
ncbi:MAG: integrase core domain-containing protein, partial [Atribacterota bacterium]|nr:integrase core domain-containing protein [Atribacterota bacterium]